MWTGQLSTGPGWAADLGLYAGETFWCDWLAGCAAVLADRLRLIARRSSRFRFRLRRASDAADDHGRLENLPAETIDGEILRTSLKSPRGSRCGNAGDSRLVALNWRFANPIRCRPGFGSTIKKHNVELQLVNAKFSDPISPERWQLKAAEGDKIERCRFASDSICQKSPFRLFSRKVPTLGPAIGDIKVVAREGAGRLEIHDGTRVLIMKGTPEEMGRQHGFC